MFPNRLVDWRGFHLRRRRQPAAVDSRRRLGYCLAAFVVLLAVIFGRFVQLEVTQGAAFRAEASKPLLRRLVVPGRRGRILARDGTVLAHDETVPALAVHYRYLEQPPNPMWLRWQARRRLAAADRRDPRRLRQEEEQFRRRQRAEMRKLAELCGLSPAQWQRRAARIQSRVERIADRVNRFHRRDSAGVPSAGRPRPDTGGGRWYPRRILDLVQEALAGSIPPSTPTRITVAEELDYHVMAEGLPLEVVAEIENHPDKYPGVKIVEQIERVYPRGPLAAHVLGYVGPVTPEDLTSTAAPPYHTEDRVGRTGLERQYEHLLRAVHGVAVEVTDRSGQHLATYWEKKPRAGRDVICTLDPQLQQAAEKLLADALRRGSPRSPQGHPAGGAIVVMNVHTGALLAAASAPSFDPNHFASPQPTGVKSLLEDPTHPLFNRAVQMAIPPGSVFKIVSAVALLESGTVRPDEPTVCRGYVDSPDRWRCAIYRRRGIGHGPVTLSDALCVSCNVFFFRAVEKLPPAALVGWALDFGFGQRTGIDLPGEAAGMVPTPEGMATHRGPWRLAHTRLLAIGQGALQVTPIQVARMIAAVANGGRLVTPHLVSRLGLPEDPGQSAGRAPNQLPQLAPAQPIPQLSPETLAVLHDALKRVVADPRGTAHATLHIAGLAVAGKTGTAETGAGRAEHAWFAGYLPADNPQLAMVVVLEHAGDAADTACPVAQRLAMHIQQAGLLDSPRPPLR